MKQNVHLIFAVSALLTAFTFIAIIFVTAPDETNANTEEVIVIPKELMSSEDIFLMYENRPIEPEEPVLTESDILRQNKLDELRNMYNDDVVAHLKIDGTSIDYPVFQSSDNEYYLNSDHNGNYSVAGSIFLDFENDISKEDRNTIIYGHNMNQDYMFHSLRYYQDKDYFDEHKYIVLDTYDRRLIWEVFAFYKTDTAFNYIKVFFADDNDFLALINEMRRRSLFETNISVTEKDRVLTLSTCSNQESNTRYVVNAKLIN